MGEVKHLNVTIYGHVQGVGFRYSAQRQAQKLNIMGFARNESDGSIYIEAEGGEAELNKFLKWCGKGPWSAKVEKAESAWSDSIVGFQEFSVG